MEEFVLEIVRQAPALAVLAWIVYQFLGYLRDQNSRTDSLFEAYGRRSREALELARRVNETLGETAEVLRGCQAHIREMQEQNGDRRFEP